MDANIHACDKHSFEFSKKVKYQYLRLHVKAAKSYSEVLTEKIVRSILHLKQHVFTAFVRGLFSMANFREIP